MSQDEFSKLYELIHDFQNDLGSRFDKVEKRFEMVEGRFDKVEERFDSQFMKLYNHVEEFRSEVNGRFEKVDEKFDGVNSRLDEQTKMINDNHLEIVSLGVKVDRVEKNTHELADKIGHKLSRST